MAERLHKLLAQHGIASRREVEKWMLAGRILLNGRPAAPGDRYSPGDRVVLDGRDVTSRLSRAAAAQVLLYHKPQGQPIGASASEADEGSMDKSVMESLPSVRGARWLVINTMQAGDSGLMLVTNDGRLADGLRRRAETIPAAYVARVLVPAEFDVDSLPRLVQYDDEAVEFQSVEPAGGEGTNRWFRVESQRAHRRAAVRALFESCGLKVSRVIQVKFADLDLPRDLPRGKHRALSDKQVASLYARAELERPIAPEATRHGRAGRNRGGPRPGRPRKRVTGSRKSAR
jgi:23S rRNA pseudouridine2605 synthase